MIAHEYGYTFDQIRNMTMRDVDIAMKNINIRRHNDFVSQCRLHGAQGIDYHKRPRDVEEINLTKEQENITEQAINERFRAIQERNKRG